MGEKVLTIALIEDNQFDAMRIKEAFKDGFNWLKENDYFKKMEFDYTDLCFEDVCGSEKVTIDNKEFRFFKDEDFSSAEKILNEVVKKEHAGILMDILLTKNEQDQANLNRFDNVEYCKRFVSNPDWKKDIYIITKIRSISSRLWSIFHDESLNGRYILKGLVTGTTKSIPAIARVLKWMDDHEYEFPDDLFLDIERTQTGWYDMHKRIEAGSGENI